MHAGEVTIAGTLNADGSLALDGKPDLPPGRVRVVLRAEPAPSPPPESMFEFFVRVRRELAASGSKFMNEEEVEAHIAWLRAGDRIDDRLRDLDVPG